MSRLHILQQTSNNVYDVVVHAPTPVGNNSAGVPFATAIQNAGLATTTMTVGNGAGQITTAESNQVAAGTVVEAPFQWEDNPAWDNTTRTADLNLRAQQAVDAVLAAYGARLKYFGRVVA